MDKDKLICVIILTLLLKSCVSADYSLWKFKKKRISGFDSSKICFRTDGFYIPDFKNEKHFDFRYALIFFKDGYFCSPHLMDSSYYNPVKIDLRANEYLHWGRYEVNDSEILIQFYGFNTVSSGGLPPSLFSLWKVVELECHVLNDTTIILKKERVQIGSKLIEVKIDYDTYKFVKRQLLFSSDNWIMEEIKSGNIE